MVSTPTGQRVVVREPRGLSVEVDGVEQFVRCKTCGACVPDADGPKRTHLGQVGREKCRRANAGFETKAEIAAWAQKTSP